jgi:NAD(P)-dependent dehydrogenase (short-subunit alcohol dehydrogenase family)
MDAAGRLDVLFNNAGMFGPSGPLDEIPIEAFDEVLAVNIRGMVIAARLAFRPDAAAIAARRADHQQRLALGLCAAPGFDLLHHDQTRDYRAHAHAVA